MAAAAGLATLETYREEDLFGRAAGLAGYWEDALHSLKGLPHVTDIRNMGLIGAVELEPIAGEPTKRAFQAFLDCYERGVLIRTTGDIIAMSPPLIIEKEHIDQLIGTLGDVLRGTGLEEEGQNGRTGGEFTDQWRAALGLADGDGQDRARCIAGGNNRQTLTDEDAEGRAHCSSAGAKRRA